MSNMVEIKYDRRAQTRLIKKFRKRRKLKKELQQVTDRNGRLLLSMVRQMSPRDTGEYQAAWTLETQDDGILVFNPSPQGLRLELGFFGIDSSGRHYNQGPQPHARPALEIVAPIYKQEIREATMRMMDED